MKFLSIALIALMSLSTMAHEGGHGELEEGGKFGGITSPVVGKAEAGKGNKAKTLFKSELVRSEDGTLRLYLYDEKMNLLSLNDFGEKVEAKLEVKKKGKFTYFGSFELKKASNHFVGKLPSVEYKPFNVDLFLTHKQASLFVGYSNLD